MNHNTLQTWRNLYQCALEIGRFAPWNDFKPGDPLVYIDPRNEHPIFYDFVKTPWGDNGIACYFGEQHYIASRKRLYTANEKEEPVFWLQDALVALWGCRKDVSPKNYAIIKELTYRFRGDGHWLYFEKYQLGYAPTELSDEDIELMMDALGNLHMMMRAVYEHDVKLDFENGLALSRWYSKKDQLYYTHSLPLPLSNVEERYPCIQIKENEYMRQVKNSPASNIILELDWFYLDTIIEYQNRDTIPLVMLFVDSKSGLILEDCMLSPMHSLHDSFLNKFDDLYSKLGKPKEFRVCDRAFYTFIFDFCQKINIKLTFKKQLPALNKVRKEIY